MGAAAAKFPADLCCGSLCGRSDLRFSGKRFWVSLGGRSYRQFLAGISVARSKDAATAIFWQAFPLLALGAQLPPLYWMPFV